MSLPRMIFILMLLLQASTFAYSAKEGNVTASLGPYFYKTNFEGSPSGAKSPLFGDLALIVNGDISDSGSLEIALFHMKKLFIREQSGNYLGEETEMIQINMGYRRWLNSIFSVSMALYSSYAMGDPRVVHNDFTATNQIDTSARDITEYGFDFSIQAELWARARYSVILDTRYSKSVTSKSNERGDHYGAIVAAKYFIQEKQFKERPK